MKKLLFIFVLTLLVISACHKKEQFPTDVVRVQQSNQKEEKDPYLDWNRVNVDREDEDIDFFVKRYDWNVQKTGTGLRMEVLSPGTGRNIQTEDIVTLKYTTCLLTGDTLYKSDEIGLKKFKVDKSEEPVGLNEAVKMLKKGSKAHMVIPSFLAYGVAGDGDKIKGKVSLAMTIEIVDVE